MNCARSPEVKWILIVLECVALMIELVVLVVDFHGNSLLSWFCATWALVHIIFIIQNILVKGNQKKNVA